jgi:hypothetical protein
VDDFYEFELAPDDIKEITQLLEETLRNHQWREFSNETERYNKA